MSTIYGNMLYAGKAQVIVQIPTVSVGTYTYNGTPQGPSVSNLDTSNITTTHLKETNAGSYTLILHLSKSGAIWSDGTTEDKTYAYTINKANASITVSSDTVTLDTNTLSVSITVGGVGGDWSASSSNTSIATVTKSDNTLTIISPNEETGTANITISRVVTTNYNAVTKVVEVTALFAQIFGAEWPGTSTTVWSRTDAAANFTNPSPAVNNGNGSSPFDDYMPWSGMRRVEDSVGGTLVEIPKYWYKWTRSGSSMKLQISNGPQDGFFVSPAHADRGDGKGERDVVYVGAYHCASTYKSTTGVKPLGNKTRSDFRTGIKNLGVGIYQYDFAMYWTIMMLYLVEYADWNSQKVIGYGCGNQSGTENNGLCDAMVYHTGTNASSRTTYGHIRYRWIEGLWDNVYDWCDGIYFSGANVYGIKNPERFSDNSGGTLISTRSTSSNYISAWSNPTADGFEYALYPTAVSGSGDTYVCDYCFYDSSGVVLYVGGGHSPGQYYGAFYLVGNCADWSAYASVGSRLQKLP